MISPAVSSTSPTGSSRIRPATMHVATWKCSAPSSCTVIRSRSNMRCSKGCWCASILRPTRSGAAWALMSRSPLSTPATSNAMDEDIPNNIYEMLQCRREALCEDNADACKWDEGSAEAQLRDPVKASEATDDDIMSWLRPLSLIEEEQTTIRSVQYRPDPPPPRGGVREMPTDEVDQEHQDGGEGEDRAPLRPIEPARSRPSHRA